MFPVEHTEVGCVDIVKHSSCWVEGESGASWQVQQCSHTLLIGSLEYPPGVRLESCQPGLTEGLTVPELPLGSLCVKALRQQCFIPPEPVPGSPGERGPGCPRLPDSGTRVYYSFYWESDLRLKCLSLKPSQRKPSQFWAGLGPCHQNVVILLANPGHSILRVHQIFSDRHI